MGKEAQRWGIELVAVGVHSWHELGYSWGYSGHSVEGTELAIVGVQIEGKV